jgi:hypothetical protein
MNGPLAVPCGRPFTLGTHRLELFASGHSLGAASLLADLDEARIVYAGVVNPRGIGLGGAADVRSCDALIVSARFASSDYAFSDASGVVEELSASCEKILQDGGTALCLVESAGQALDLVHLLGDAFEYAAHRTLYRALSSVSKLHRLPAAKLFGSRTAKKPRVLLWPLRHRSRVPTEALPAASQVILVSGMAVDRAAIDRVGASLGFPLSAEADLKTLVEYIAASGASEVFLTNAIDEGAALSQALPGLRISLVGPPEQMTLF